MRGALDPRGSFRHDRLVRVISWNMGMAGPRRRRPGLHDQAWHYLLGLGPDLAFLQETLPPAWVRNEGLLVHGPFKQWGSVIFSARYPLERLRLPKESHLHALGSYLAVGAVSLPDGTEAFVASVHAPARKATKAQMGGVDPSVAARLSVGHPRVNDVVFVGLEGLVGDRFIVAGDWNTGREQGSQRARNAGAEFFERARQRGWYDCVWDKLGKEVQTWFRAGDSLRQNDHAFCDQGLGSQLEDVKAAADAVTDLGLSDHAPLILDFTVTSIAMANLTEEHESTTETES